MIVNATSVRVKYSSIHRRSVHNRYQSLTHGKLKMKTK